MAGLELVAGPSQEPITITNVKEHLRLDEDVDDLQVNAYIIAARQWAESYTGRIFVGRSMRQWYDSFGDMPIMNGTVQGHQSYLSKQRYLEISANPVLSVESIKYYNDAGTESTWDSSNYYVDNVSHVARIALKDGGEFPTDLRKFNGLAVNFTAGYSTSASLIPQAIKVAMMQYITYLYEHRGDDENTARPPRAAIDLLSPYKVMRFGVSAIGNSINMGIV